MDDPLDSSEFDPITYINENFPTENSLNNLDTYMVGLNSKIGALEEEISKSVQSQSTAGQQATKDINEAQSSIKDLYVKVQDIKVKASQSEKMVQEICADIKKLDYAKTHLQSSITALKRLQMLITAVGQLEILAKEYQYREVANLLDAVKQLMTHFDPYTDIPMIYELRSRIEIIQTELKNQVHQAFREVGQMIDSVADVNMLIQGSSVGSSLRSLPDACLVVDALGATARKDLVDEFVLLQLQPYESLFGTDKPHFTLEDVDRRWAWLKRLIRTVDAKFSTLCPAHWRFPLRICVSFIDKTKIHLLTLLERLDSKEKIDVSVLLKALQTTLKFEQEMDIHFTPIFAKSGIDFAAVEAENNAMNGTSGSGASAGGEGMAVNTSNSLKANDNLNHNSNSSGNSNNNNNSNNGSNSNISAEEREFLIQARQAIKGGPKASISGVFDRFLGSYVLLEKSNLEDLLKRLSQEEDTAGNSNKPTTSGSSGSSGNSNNDEEDSSVTRTGDVFNSSISMFVFIKNSIKRCTALTTGQTFLALTKEFKTCMQQYAELLKNRCPPLMMVTAMNNNTTSNTPSSTSNYSSLSSSSTNNMSALIAAASIANANNTTNTTTGYIPQPLCRLSPNQESLVCYLINTGEYCSEVVPQLEQLIKSKMAFPYNLKVDLSSEADVFDDLVSLGLKVVIGGAMEKLDQAFRSMAGNNWASDGQVGEESAYVLQINTKLSGYVSTVREYLSSTYFNSFCTRLATEILLKFHDIIMRQKMISEAGSQQLLLDTYNLKTLLLHLHSIGISSSSSSLTGDHGSGGGSGGHKNNLSIQPPPSVYSKFILTKASHIEMILKLVGTPSDMLIERFRIMLPDGRLDDLVSIMTLKGLKKMEQQTLLDSQSTLIAPLLQQATNKNISTTTPSGNTAGSGTSGGSSSSYFSLDAASQLSSTGAAAMASSVSSLTQNITTNMSSLGSNLKWGK